MENAGKAIANLVNNRFSGGFSTYVTNKFMAVFAYLTTKSERINAWRRKYETYLEEEKRRKERNDYILAKLDKMRDISTVPLKFSVNRRYKNLAEVASINTPQQQRVFNDPRLHSNVDNGENNLIQQIVNKFILIPKRMFNAVSDNMTPHDLPLEEKILMADKNLDWRRKYEILDQIKQGEKQIDDDCVYHSGPNDCVDTMPVKDVCNSSRVASQKQNENKINTTINLDSEIVKDNSVLDGIRSMATTYSFNAMRNTHENINLSESINKQQNERQEEKAFNTQQELPKVKDAHASSVHFGETELDALPNLNTEALIKRSNHDELRYNEGATYGQNEMGNVQFSDKLNKRNPDDDLKYLQQKGEEQQEQSKDTRKEGCLPGEEDVHARQTNIHKEHDQKLHEKPNVEQQKHSTSEEAEDKYMIAKPIESENIEEEINLQEDFDPEVKSVTQDSFFEVPATIEDNDIAAVTNAQDFEESLVQENYESDQRYYHDNPETIEVADIQNINAEIGAPLTTTDVTGLNQELVYSDMHQAFEQQQGGEQAVEAAQHVEQNQYYYHPSEQPVEISNEEATLAYDPSYEQQYQGTFEYTEPVVYDETKQQEDLQKEYEANIYAQQVNYDDEVQIDASAYNRHLQQQNYQYDSQAGYEQPQENYTDEQIVQQSEGAYNDVAPEQYYVDQQQSVNVAQGQASSPK